MNEVYGKWTVYGFPKRPEEKRQTKTPPVPEVSVCTEKSPVSDMTGSTGTKQQQVNTKTNSAGDMTGANIQRQQAHPHIQGANHKYVGGITSDTAYRLGAIHNGGCIIDKQKQSLPGFDNLNKNCSGAAPTVDSGVVDLSAVRNCDGGQDKIVHNGIEQRREVLKHDESTDVIGDKSTGGEICEDSVNENDSEIEERRKYLTEAAFNTKGGHAKNDGGVKDDNNKVSSDRVLETTLLVFEGGSGDEEVGEKGKNMDKTSQVEVEKRELEGKKPLTKRKADGRLLSGGGKKVC